MMNQPATWSSRILPPDAIARLQRAAQTPIPQNDPLARLKAIERAAQWTRLKYPRYFR